MKCLNCGLATKKWGNHNNKYCDLKCKREYESKTRKALHPEIECKICGNKFISKYTLSKYCSNRCSKIAQLKKSSKKEDIKKCSFCGKLFLV